MALDQIISDANECFHELSAEEREAPAGKVLLSFIKALRSRRSYEQRARIFDNAAKARAMDSHVVVLQDEALNVRLLLREAEARLHKAEVDHLEFCKQNLLDG